MKRRWGRFIQLVTGVGGLAGCKRPVPKKDGTIPYITVRFVILVYTGRYANNSDRNHFPAASSRKNHKYLRLSAWIFTLCQN